MVESATALSGMKEICYYVRRSESTVLQWIRELDFPAKKIGGVWESDRTLVDQWRKEQINGRQIQEAPAKKTAKRSSRRGKEKQTQG
jgi:hypothetical protein